MTTSAYRKQGAKVASPIPRLALPKLMNKGHYAAHNVASYLRLDGYMLIGVLLISCDWQNEVSM